jgi:hypothetical protein
VRTMGTTAARIWAAGGIGRPGEGTSVPDQEERGTLKCHEANVAAFSARGACHGAVGQPVEVDERQPTIVADHADPPERDRRPDATVGQRAPDALPDGVGGVVDDDGRSAPGTRRGDGGEADEHAANCVQSARNGRSSTTRWSQASRTGWRRGAMGRGR